ncbi:MAG: FtsX-like permease family protein, partial [Bdellovibrio sp.]
KDSLKFAEGGWASKLGEVVLGAGFATAQHLKVGDTVNAHLWVGEKPVASGVTPLKVVGVFQATTSAWDRMAYTNIETAYQVFSQLPSQRLSTWGGNVLNYFLVYLHPQGFSDLQTLINDRTVGQAVQVSREKEKLEKLVGVGQNLGLFVTALILVLGGLTVTSVLVTRFEAMSLQLAVLRAIGYQKITLAKWLLWEGFLMGAVACLVGLVFDALAFPFVRQWLGDSLPSADVLGSSLWQSYPVWLIALLATMMSVFIPLYRVYRQDVHFSLRD